ncbi:hypothetical protein [Mucilaginibacter flavidus]|uniref:hypothetical protein n=1 Tax=Mucilaginibacter flavidus TaxID=2949309 RepID=UPI0020936EF3|nr:hypothetical protein [Mucilaginibacter flavidus]MCO5949437.1 hypothetical protein [Mucilaginibacter flavidus]
MASMWGENHDKKMAEFELQVEDIEERNFGLFKNQINHISGKAPDKLSHQFLTTWDDRRYTIGFSKHTYVPKQIQDEVINAFKGVFSEK